MRERLGGRTPSPTASGIAGETTPPVFPRQPPGWDVSAVTAEDLAVVRQFLDRRATLTVGARNHLAREIATRLQAKVAGAPALEPETFLERLAAARD